MRVRFTRPAQADLQSIYEHVRRDDPGAASRLVADLIERARSLGENPHQGRETDEPNARVVVVAKLRYFIFYSVNSDEVPAWNR